MKYRVPILITMIAGFIMIIREFIPHEPFDRIDNWLQDWYMVVAAFAIVLGIESLLHLHSRKISFKRKDWQYSVVLIVSLLLMSIAGIFGGIEDKTFLDMDNPTQITELLATEIDTIDGKRTVAQMLPADASAMSEQEQGAYIYSQLKTITVEVEDKIKVSTRHPDPKRKYTIPALYLDRKQLSLKQALKRQQIILHRGGLGYLLKFYLFGGFQFSYQYIYTSLMGTMFSLLAFFVASAAYRAFKARTLEATLLLLAAFFVMIGRVTFGTILGNVIGLDIPQITDWIMNYPVTAGQKAIMIGIALGLISTSLRIILGIEKSYLGRE